MVSKLDRKTFDRELERLQRELVIQQHFIREQGLRVVVVFEGRDAAGKGGAIKRIEERLNPRWARTVALAKPTEREQTQWYFQRYVAHLPAAGEMVMFDRSWYNRAGVERVMGFCTEPQYQQAPWYVVEADDKRRARLNCMSHLLSLVPYDDLTPSPVELPPRNDDIAYVRPPMEDQTFVPDVY